MCTSSVQVVAGHPITEGGQLDEGPQPHGTVWSLTKRAGRRATDACTPDGRSTAPRRGRTPSHEQACADSGACPESLRDQLWYPRAGIEHVTLPRDREHLHCTTAQPPFCKRTGRRSADRPELVHRLGFRDRARERGVMSAARTTYETLLVELDRGVTLVTLNRPDQLQRLQSAVEPAISDAPGVRGRRVRCGRSWSRGARTGVLRRCRPRPRGARRERCLPSSAPHALGLDMRPSEMRTRSWPPSTAPPWGWD